MNTLTFYQEQSAITNPGIYAHHFDSITPDIAYITNLVQQLVLHFWDGNLFNYRIPIKQVFEIDTRYIADILHLIFNKDDRPLQCERALKQRFIGSCRDFASLICAILRHCNIPARTRVAFSSYHFKDFYHDVIIVEYWNKTKDKWCMVDPRTTEKHIHWHQLHIDFDLFDVPDDKFIVAGKAWQLVRRQELDPLKFGGGNQKGNHGLWYIRDRLIQDIAALNKMEMLLWDAWGLMLHHQEPEKYEHEQNFLDEIAEMSLETNKHHDMLVHTYHTDKRLSIGKKIMSYSPVAKAREILWDKNKDDVD